MKKGRKKRSVLPLVVARLSCLCPCVITPRGFTSLPTQEAECNFSGLIPTNKQNKKKVNGRRRGCWAYAAEWPGFSIVEVLFIHILCSRWKILAVLHISSAQCRGGHLVGSGQIRRRATQIIQWQDVRYRQEFAPL